MVDGDLEVQALPQRLRGRVDANEKVCLDVGTLTTAEDGEPVAEEKVGTQAGRGIGLSTIIWLLVVISIVILNFLGQGRG